MTDTTGKKLIALSLILDRMTRQGIEMDAMEILRLAKKTVGACNRFSMGVALFVLIECMMIGLTGIRLFAAISGLIAGIVVVKAGSSLFHGLRYGTGFMVWGVVLTMELDLVEWKYATLGTDYLILHKRLPLFSLATFSSKELYDEVIDKRKAAGLQDDKKQRSRDETD